MRRLPFLLVLSLFAVSHTLSANITRDAAWEKYVVAQKKLQNAMHYHLGLYDHAFKKYIEISQRLRLGLADIKSKKFYYLLNQKPERITRDQGFSAFVNFDWSQEDEAALLESDRSYRKLRRSIDKLKVDLEKAPYKEQVRESLEDFKTSTKYKEVLARFRFVSEEVDKILKGEVGDLDSF